jgi:hypothetical protein
MCRLSGHSAARTTPLWFTTAKCVSPLALISQLASYFALCFEVVLLRGLTEWEPIESASEFQKHVLSRMLLILAACAAPKC